MHLFGDGLHAVLFSLGADGAEVVELGGFEISDRVSQIERTHDVAVKRAVIQTKDVTQFVRGRMAHMLEKHLATIGLYRSHANVCGHIHMRVAIWAEKNASLPRYVSRDFVAVLLDVGLEGHLDFGRLIAHRLIQFPSGAESALPHRDRVAESSGAFDLLFFRHVDEIDSIVNVRHQDQVEMRDRIADLSVLEILLGVFQVLRHVREQTTPKGLRTIPHARGGERRYGCKCNKK